MTHEEYHRNLRSLVKTNGMIGLARMLDVSKQRVYAEMKSRLKRTDDRDRNVFLERLGVRRVVTVHYEVIPGGVFDASCRDDAGRDSVIEPEAN